MLHIVVNELKCCPLFGPMYFELNEEWNWPYALTLHSFFDVAGYILTSMAHELSSHFCQHKMWQIIYVIHLHKSEKTN